MTAYTRQCKPKPEQVPAWRGARGSSTPAKELWGILSCWEWRERYWQTIFPNTAPDKSASHTPRNSHTLHTQEFLVILALMETKDSWVGRGGMNLGMSWGPEGKYDRIVQNSQTNKRFKNKIKWKFWVLFKEKVAVILNIDRSFVPFFVLRKIVPLTIWWLSRK